MSKKNDDHGVHGYGLLMSTFIGLTICCFGGGCMVYQRFKHYEVHSNRLGECLSIGAIALVTVMLAVYAVYFKRKAREAAHRKKLASEHVRYCYYAGSSS